MVRVIYMKAWDIILPCYLISGITFVQGSHNFQWMHDTGKVWPLPLHKPLQGHILHKAVHGKSAAPLQLHAFEAISSLLNYYIKIAIPDFFSMFDMIDWKHLKAIHTWFCVIKV